MIRRGFFLLTLLFSILWGQTFRLNGNASALGGNCYQVTDSISLTRGAAWSQTTVDFNQPFDINIDVMLGCTDRGADGMTFSFVNSLNRLGLQGGFLGIAGVSPSFSIEFDTYYNGGFGDERFDHMAITYNGGVNHTTAFNLRGPVAILPDSGNVEDCQLHDLRVVWDPVTDSMKVYFDCQLRLEFQGDIASTYFGGTTDLYWGLTAGTGQSGTGGTVNRHQFCVNYLGVKNPLRDTTICLGDTIQLDAGSGYTFMWGNTTGIDDAIIPNPRVFPTSTTDYTVSIFDECGGVTYDTVTITVEFPADLNVFIGRDTVLCPGQTLTLRANPTAAITWNDMSTEDTLLVSAAGLYWAEKTNVCGSQRDSVIVLPEIIPRVDLGLDQSLCDQNSFELDATFNSLTFPTTYEWQDASTQARYTAQQSGDYYVTVSNFCGSASDTVNIDMRFTPDPFDLGPDQVLCQGEQIRLDISAPDAQYRWSDNSTDSVLTINAEGLYWGERYNLCGARRDSIRVFIDEPISFDLGPDLAFCEGERTRLDMGVFPRTTYSWSNGASTSNLVVRTEAIYIGSATNACGTFSDTVNVLFDVPPMPFDLGPDVELCVGDSLDLNIFAPDRPSAPNSYFWIPTRDTSFMYQIREGGTYIANVTNRCGSVSDDIFVEMIEFPEVPDFPDSTFCSDETVFRDATWSGGEASYLWEDGFTGPSRTLTEGGLYTISVGNQCSVAVDSFFLEAIDCECTVFMPSAFSPNGDGVNDYFSFVQHCMLSQMQLDIYNRWGRLVYSGQGPDAQWDGRVDGQMAPEGVYVWVINYQGRYRTSVMARQQKGTLTLLR
jgi:gliding motility-associated-like protein